MISLARHIVLLLGLCLLASAPAQAATERELGGAFVDQFDRLDPERWFVSHGWRNGAHQGCDWSKNTVTTGGGRLFMRLETNEAKPTGVSCSEIQTHAFYHHGLYEARIKAAAGSGLNSAFFTYTGPSFGDPHDEIDFEFLGKASRRVQLNYYVDGIGDHEMLARLPRRMNDGFTVVSFLWLPGRIEWYIDGRLTHQVREGLMPEAPGKIYFSIWNGTEMLDGWLGPYKPVTNPKTMVVDWVAFTPVGDDCQIADSIACEPGFRW
ncbi:MAG: family 16 glycosylhydrolase [Pseudomonadota bacterium]